MLARCSHPRQGKLKYIDSQLAGRDYLMGSQFTVADGYLFTMLTWGDRMKFDLSAMPNLSAYKSRVAARPQLQAALKKEGLIQATSGRGGTDNKGGGSGDPAPSVFKAGNVPAV